MDDKDDTMGKGIIELRKRMKDILEPGMYEDDHLFYRFLKARDCNVNDAETMLRKHLEWRRNYDVKNALKQKHPEVLKKYFPFIILGHDKEGSVIRYCPTGNLDWIGISISCKLEDLTKFTICNIEEDIKENKKQSEKLGKTVDKCIYIHNMKNLTFAQSTDKRVLMNMIFLCDMYQNNYPELLKNVYIINISPYFKFLLPILQKVLVGTIMEKIKFYSDDSFKEDLLKVIDADVLPAFLGGTRTDPDGNPLCLTFINHGAPVPESYYIHKSKRSLSKFPGIQKLTISSSSFHEVNLTVTEPGSYIEWEFETKHRDIGFGLFYHQIINGEEENTELIPIHRIDTENFSETGLCVCEKEGSYVIVFDNTYSWFRAKEIFYRIKIVSPTEQVHQTN